MKQTINSLHIIPIQTKERTITLDILRGFALIGVLLTNLQAIVTTIPEAKLSFIANTDMDKITNTIVQVFFLSKFISLFSLLFGYGFGVFIERLESKDIHPLRFFLRRMGILLLLGMIHTGFWWGEILSTYALCGLLLLPFRKVKAQHLLTFGLIFIFMAGPFFQYLNSYCLVPEPSLRENIYTQYFQSMIHGSIKEIFFSNYEMSDELYLHGFTTLRDGIEILGEFLIGFYILKKGYLKNAKVFQSKLIVLWKISLVIGFLYVVDKSCFLLSIFTLQNMHLKLIEYVFNNLGELSLSLFYATSILLLFDKNPDRRIFNRMKYVGTMSLTNYLCQTVFYFFIFTGIGYGWIGKMHLYMIIPFTIGIFSLQIIISKFWLTQYLYGPMEWIWRQLTYWKRLRITRTPKAEDHQKMQ